MKRRSIVVLFFLIFVAGSCVDPYEATAPTYFDLVNKVDSLDQELTRVKHALELTQDAIRTENINSFTVDSVILERLKYLYSVR
jgi:hypothetical protein